MTTRSHRAQTSSSPRSGVAAGKEPGSRSRPRGFGLFQGLIGTGAVAVIGWGVASMGVLDDPIEPPTTTEIKGWLGTSGLQPDVLAAAGLTAQQTTAAANAAQAQLESSWEAVRLAESELAVARTQVSQLSKAVNAGTADETTKSNLATARAALAAAQADLGDIRDLVFDAGVDGLDPGVVADIELIGANHTAWNLPLQYAAVDRTEAEWVTLRNALAAARTCDRIGQTPDASCTQTILDANAHTDVVAAASALTNNLDAVTAAWNAACAD